MKATTVDIDALAARFLECAPCLDADGKRISLALYRILAEGEPVRVDELAEKVGLDPELVQEKLNGWPGVFFDKEGAVQGYWGLAIPRMAHRFEVGGRTLYTWCAWDSLFIPELLQGTARVSSTCPVTGEDIRLRVHPHAIENVDPTETVMSFPQVDRMEFGEDVVTNFCHFVHFFVSPDAAARWASKNAGHVILSLDNALELARRKNALQYGELL